MTDAMKSSIDEQELSPFLHIPCYVSRLSACWERVLHLGERVVCHKNQALTFNDNEYFFYVKSGMTICYVKECFGKKDEIRLFMGEKCFIRESVVSAGIGSMLTWHRCLTDVVMYRFSRNRLFDQNFLLQHGDLLQNFIFSIAAKSISVQIFYSLKKQKSNAKKIAIFIDGFYLNSGRRYAFPPPLSQAQLAELLGINTLTVNRIIAQWKQRGIIESYTKKNLRILDMDTLLRIRAGELED